MSWDKKRVVIIGAARQGTALARYLAEHGAQVTITDAQTADQLTLARQSLADLPIRWVLEGHPLELLDETDLVCISGGVPLTIPFVKEAVGRGIPLSNDSQVFMESAPCKVVGITGSAGKTTTTTLVGRIAYQAERKGFYRKVYVGGNIGLPLISLVDEMTADDLAVVEFSSFQLELMTNSPQVAAVLNISPNHLDRHKTMAAYQNAKKHIVAHQHPEDVAVLGWEDEEVRSWAEKAPGKVSFFGQEIPADQMGSFVREGGVWVRTEQGEAQVLPLSEIALRGDHNLLNVAAACAVGVALGLPVEVMHAGIAGFGGVEHRLEFVRNWGGADWYNDSKATSPGMTVTAMRSFQERLVVLVGGRDKALPWDGFAAQALRQADHVIAFGEAAGLVQAAIREAVDESKQPFELELCTGLSKAVAAAAKAVRPGQVVLLAPGGTSFDEFSDYEARGRAFKALVNQLSLEE
ncbi:UDP-N-acetylmuramoyl-L-alanine--D-glutamate ligase [bacterium]|nr:UDP-N-acetylmuramoyl-L-alanine--D-glutamate ligase [bacterium]MCB2179357.1 UDP-N-acetylmuramoyl-L-alanine--D-glutamate ligase [bacterium]